MKFKSFFLLILSLATVLSLVDTHAALADCTAWNCIVYGGRTRGGTILPADMIEKSSDLIAQGKATVADYLVVAYVSAEKGKFAEAETLYSQALQLAKQTENLEAQAAANHGLGSVYAKIGKSDLSSSHLTSAGALYKTLGNTQRSIEVQGQLRVLKTPVVVPQKLRQRF